MLPQNHVSVTYFGWYLIGVRTQVGVVEVNASNFMYFAPTKFVDPIFQLFSFGLSKALFSRRDQKLVLRIHVWKSSWDKPIWAFSVCIMICGYLIRQLFSAAVSRIQHKWRWRWSRMHMSFLLPVHGGVEDIITWRLIEIWFSPPCPSAASPSRLWSATD